MAKAPRLYADAAERQREHSRRHYKLYYKAPGFGARADRQEPPPDDVLADAIFRNAAPHASTTAAICGDPKPGQSALDRKGTIP